MMERLNKLAPFLAAGLLAYLTHSAMEPGGLQLAQGRDLPRITPNMLRPKLLEPQGRASPAERDPFDVAWASYLPAPPGPASRPAEASTQPTQPAARTPAPPRPPSLAGRLEGVVVGSGFRAAIIDGQLYKEGVEIGPSGARGKWVIERITPSGVTLRWGDSRVTWPIPAKPASARSTREDEP